MRSERSAVLKPCRLCAVTVVIRVAVGNAGRAARPDREVAMLAKFLAACGYPKPDDIVDFVMTGVAVAPIVVGLGCGLFTQQSCDAKVEDLGLVFVGHEDVARLEVPVDHASLVRV